MGFVLHLCCVCVVLDICAFVFFLTSIAIQFAGSRALQCLRMSSRPVYRECSNVCQWEQSALTFASNGCRECYLPMSTESVVTVATGLRIQRAVHFVIDHRRLQVLCVHVSVPPFPSYGASQKLYFALCIVRIENRSLVSPTYITPNNNTSISI